MPDGHERALKALERRGRLRALKPRAGADFSSNDYLGLASAPEMRRAITAALERGVPVGAGGSRLLRGNDPEHEALEAEAAAFFRAGAALYFGGGFQANVALFATLPERGDLVVHDSLIHASVHDGLRMGKAEARPAAHNDPQAFEDAIGAYRRAGGKGQAWIAVESLYSMDGDVAPLDDLIAVAERHDAMLIIDEAHATGIFGDEGRGFAAHLEGRPNIISLHTCGKALGASGGLVLSPRAIRDFLVNRARPFIYATAPSPLMAAAVRAAITLCRRDPTRRQRLMARIAMFRTALKEATGLDATGSQIQPIIAGPDQRALALAEGLQAQGFDVRAVRPPTVPEGTARLRISLTLNTSEAETVRLVGALAEALAGARP